MTDTNHAWIWIGHVAGADGELAAAFVIDERQHADAQAAQAAVTAAAEELRRRGIAHELEHVRVRLDEPAQPLPSWTDYQASLPAEDA
ncbi:hypothetical protein [Jiangella mangrovi]|uniref:L-rhamnose isomerase n=1 Tax=Jiangella mangrovi TaxID=1524084 RepID=A0A7W9GQD0_9ACTN|nr:hypothetical protein [Jiangella mangrovi]MBB5787776.1 L-rhamnose isomerase [Jiangella mangrovi]